MSTLRAYFKPKKARLEDENPEQEPEDIDLVDPFDLVDPVLIAKFVFLKSFLSPRP